MNKIELYLGDCLEKMKLLEDKSIDCIITSPPYNKSFFNKIKKSNQIWKKFQITYDQIEDNMPLEDYERWMIAILNEMNRIIKNNGSIFFNHKPIRHNNMVYHPLSFILKSNLTLYQEIIWNRFNSPNIRNDILVPCTERIYWLCKNKPKVFRQNLHNSFITEIWNIVANKQNGHPAPFPTELPTNCILLSTKETDIVLDPFCGSGTTAIACINTNRNFIGIELGKSYFDISKKRVLEQKNLINNFELVIYE